MIKNVNGATVITGERDTRFFGLLALRSALRLEQLGMRRKGTSAYAAAKAQLGVDGTREQVLTALTAEINRRQAERSAG